MDTKSKDNKTKRADIFAVLVILLIASVLFVSLYPMFRERADSLADEYRTDVMESEQFLRNLYQGNTILYKDLQEQVTGKPLRYQDVYLTVTKEPSSAGSDYFYLDGENADAYAGRKLYEMLKGWEDDFWGNFNHTIDYQITDHISGTEITNTGRDLKQLGTEDASAEIRSRYPYYIKMSYDNAGYLEHVWVKGEDSESLLKNVQRVMRSSYLERSLYDYYDDDTLAVMISQEDFYYYDSVGNMMHSNIQVNNTPRNCTVCYALTQEQKDYLINADYYQQEIDSWSAYSSVGVSNVFQMFLLILGILALLLPLSKHYHLHELWILGLHLEILLVILVVLFGFMGTFAIEMVMYSMEGGADADMPAMIRSYLPNLSMNTVEMIVVGINVLCLYLMFGFWYILVTGLAQVHTLGLKRYLRERSICYRVWQSVHAFGSRTMEQLKEEVLHVNLEKNTNRVLFKIVVINYLFLAFLSMLWFAGVFILLFYSAILYIALKKYIRHIQAQYRHLLAATQSIADGNLQTEFTGDWGVFESYKSNLAEIQQGFSKAVEEEVKSQRMRTELITNVSHDLKTPLTAITTYIELLQEEGVTEEQRREYLDVLAAKARRLKILIEDLFEVSKATSGNISLQLDRVDIGNLMRQAYLEYEDKVEQADLIFRFLMPEEKQFLMLDSQKTYRIFENLYLNIIKYALPHTRVYVSMDRQGEDVVIKLKNISKAELNINPESLTERFVRGDSSRNTEGSGLGLAIARSFVELQKGQMKVEIDGDLFKVTIVWKGL